MDFAIIIHAPDEQQAKKKMDKVLTYIKEKYIPFDYSFDSIFLHKKGAYSSSNTTDSPTAVLPETPKGQKIVECCWAGWVNRYRMFVELIMTILQSSPVAESVKEDRKKKMCHYLPKYKEKVAGSDVYPAFLYLGDKPITSKRQLNTALKPEERLKAFIFPIWCGFSPSKAMTLKEGDNIRDAQNIHMESVLPGNGHYKDKDCKFLKFKQQSPGSLSDSQKRKESHYGKRNKTTG